MPILDGAASASVLPPQTVVLLNLYSDELARAAVEQQHKHGLALRDMLGLIIVADDVMAGVARTADVFDQLLEDAPPPYRDRLRVFVGREMPATHLRVVVWDEYGISMLRVDVVPPQSGASA